MGKKKSASIPSHTAPVRTTPTVPPTQK